MSAVESLVATEIAAPGLAFDQWLSSQETRPEQAIQIRELRKNYGEFEAVKGINLEIAAGEIFGLIGPDGAGKTSVFQILGGVMQATAGAVEMYNVPARDARSFVGYLTQTFSLYQDLSVAENLRYLGELRLLSREQIEKRGLHYLKMFDMERFTDRLAGSLSGGMKQKLALACALIAEPKILLLDEPTTGVDPVSRREFWDALANLSNAGMTMVVATPYLDEAERCHRVALMHDGQIHQVGTPAEIRTGLGLDRLQVRSENLGQAEEVLSSVPEIADVQRFGDRLDVMVRDDESGAKVTAETLSNAGIAVTEIKPTSPTLENAFVATLRRLGGELERSCAIAALAFPRHLSRDRFLLSADGEFHSNKTRRRKRSSAWLQYRRCNSSDLLRHSQSTLHRRDRY
jgi:ABC-2 type transport system ATP-binding protein